jgi:hypothetical protein
MRKNAKYIRRAAVKTSERQKDTKAGQRAGNGREGIRRAARATTLGQGAIGKRPAAKGVGGPARLDHRAGEAKAALDLGFADHRRGRQQTARRKPLAVEERAIEKIRPYAGNPRVNDQAVDAVAASIREFGFRQPIVVDGKGTIVVGQNRERGGL